MPGSPPISVTLPMTIPPPRTRSSSLMPVTMRLFSSVVLMLFSFCGTRLVCPVTRGAAAALPEDALAGSATTSSVMVFHAPPGRAAPQPAGAGLAALGADVDGFEFFFGHGCLLKVDTLFIIAQNTPGGKYAQYKNICSRKSAILITDLTAEECGTPHGNNERIRVETVGRAVKFYVRLMRQC